MPHLKTRRGAIVVIVGLMMMALMAVTALSVDFSRLWTLRNELQTSADAAAHAGAVQLNPPNNAGVTDSVARSYATLNRAMQGVVTIDSVELGQWIRGTKTFVPGAPVTDAVRVVVSRQATGLIMQMFGVPLPRIKARAVGWAGAPVVNNQNCMLPLAIPYTQLMYRINLERGIPNTPDTLGMYRPFDQVNDMAALSNMSTSERTFSLKIGSGQLADTLGQMSGNYQAVRMGTYWDASSGTYTNPGPLSGANEFRENMACNDIWSLSVGDSLLSETGNMVGPAICGAWPNAQGCPPINGPGLCNMIRGDKADPLSTPQSSGSFGNCEDANGNIGVDVSAAFYRCVTGCNGQSTMEVSMLGSFHLTKVFPENSKNGAYRQFDAAEIEGIFKPLSDPGTVGPGSTTLVRPILVR